MVTTTLPVLQLHRGGDEANDLIGARNDTKRGVLIGVHWQLQFVKLTGTTHTVKDLQ